MWIDGRDFYLNGTRIYLSAVPLDNAQGSATMASYNATRNTLQLYKSRGVNFVYTHNYGCEPGTHISFDEILQAADDEGVLVALSQPRAGQYDWTAPDAETTNRYAQHAAFFVSVAGNHPSVVFYSANHNSAGYAEDMNPNMTDGILNARRLVVTGGRARPAGRKHRAQTGSEPDLLPSRGRQSRADAHHQLLRQLGPRAGNVGLVRALGHDWREAPVSL